MPHHNAPIGAVLAGGAGRRIGGGKAIVELHGRPLLSYPVGVLQAVLGEVAVVAKPQTELPDLPGVHVWHEPEEPHHPLAGIVHALQQADGRAVLVEDPEPGAVRFAAALLGETVRSLEQPEGRVHPLGRGRQAEQTTHGLLLSRAVTACRARTPVRATETGQPSSIRTMALSGHSVRARARRSFSRRGRSRWTLTTPGMRTIGRMFHCQP